MTGRDGEDGQHRKQNAAITSSLFLEFFVTELLLVGVDDAVTLGAGFDAMAAHEPDTTFVATVGVVDPVVLSTPCFVSALSVSATLDSAAEDGGALATACADALFAG